MRKLYFLCLLLVGFVSASAQFYFTPVYAGRQVAFLNNGQVIDTLNRRLFWKFGDGQSTFTLARANASHVYTQAGTYVVCAQVYTVSPSNPQDTLSLLSTYCDVITISPNATTADSCGASRPFSFQQTNYGPYNAAFGVYGWHAGGRPATSMYWTFGDGNSATTTPIVLYPSGPYSSITHNYQSTGTYNACVTIQYEGGCTATRCTTIDLVQAADTCRAEFTIQQPATSAPATVNFTAQPWHNNNKRLVSACWNWGDGSPQQCFQGTATTPAPLNATHTFTANGAYNVYLTLQYEGGCSKSITHAVVIGNGPAVADTCGGQWTEVPDGTGALRRRFDAYPYHNTQKPLTKICWNWGDGGQDTCVNYANGFNGNPVFHNYAANGTYYVCATFTYQGGCQKSVCRWVTIGNDTCSTDFSTSYVVGFGSLQPFFTLQNTHSNGRPVTNSGWTFGDGSPQVWASNQPSPVGGTTINHRYAGPGNYNVCVITWFDGGCYAQKCRNVVVVDSSNTPAPDSCGGYFVATAGATPMSRNFIASPWHNHQKPVTKICWNWGNGTDTCINYPNGYTASSLSHSWTTPGNYYVCVTFTYEGGCQKTYCQTVSITAPPPPPADSCRANFSMAVLSMNPGGSAVVGFNAIPYHNNQKPVTKICWNWGDGRDTCVTYTNGYTGGTISHRYDPLGTFNPCVTITYQGGCVAQQCSPIVLQAPADSCRAAFTIAPVTATPLARNFSAQPWHNNQKRVTKVCWLWGDGRDTCITYAAGATNFSAPHAYQQYGTYTVCVTITYEGGCASTRCQTITVMPPPPPPPAGNCGARFAVIGSGTSATSRGFVAIPDSLRRPVNICWSWGDGSAQQCVPQPNPVTAASLTATHMWNAPGTYQVCMTITYDGGCVAQRCEMVTIQSPYACSVSFRDTTLPGNVVRLEATGLADPADSIISYRWYFGDGTSALGRVQQHAYLSGGSYQVCVVMKTRNGCQAQQCRLVTVGGPAITLLTILPNPVSTVLHANFYSTGQGVATLRIINASGLVVRTESRPCYPGMNFWNLNVATLPTGYYTLIVQAPNQYAVKAFFKN